ncbi:MAG TPA: PA14 domain-containing protein [Polyangia bacterium]|nr:PA14 domain-containing protein [Polyangia bacterium]
MKPSLKPHRRLALLALASAWFMSCGPSQPPPVRIVVTLPEAAAAAALRQDASLAPAGLTAAAQPTAADVTRIDLRILDTASGRLLFGNLTFVQQADKSWTLTLPFLPRDRQLSFEAHAYDKDANDLFDGTTTVRLTQDHQTVAISLAPYDDGATYTIPRITRVAVPTAVGSGSDSAITVSVTATAGETLDYQITAAPGGGQFNPPAGSLTLSTPSNDFIFQYQAPSVAQDTDFTHTLLVRNSRGNAVQTTIVVHVLPQGAGTKNTQIRIRFSPIITQALGQRLPGTSNVQWEATATTPNDSQALTYHWSFTPTGSDTPAPDFIDTGRVSTLINYTTAAQGLITLTVADPAAGTTTLHLDLKPGEFPDAPVQPQTDTPLVQLAAGSGHTCAIEPLQGSGNTQTGGAIHCWGKNAYGQLGYGHKTPIGDDEAPYLAGTLPGLEPATQLVSGADHTCSLLNNGQVVCWGRNDDGQLGYHTTQPLGDDEPLAPLGYVAVGANVLKLAAGASHTCALLENHQVRCWGRNDNGQLGLGHKLPIGDDEYPYEAPTVNLGSDLATDLVAGDAHTCALLQGGRVRCWGQNNAGQLGLGNTTSTTQPATQTSGDINLGGVAVQLTAGKAHTCALLANGAVRCWGRNESGQLGYSSNAAVGDNETPAAAGDVNLGGLAFQVVAGGSHTCALLSTGDVKCWGKNDEGQLGYGNTTSLNAPGAAVDLGGPALRLAAGEAHTCAIHQSGYAWCWGRNGDGQLGYGDKGPLGDDEAPGAGGPLGVFPSWWSNNCHRGDFPNNTWNTCVYDGQNLNHYAGPASSTSIDNDWGTGGPLGRSDNFSIVSRGTFCFPTGDYYFFIDSDDGARLWLDGQLLVDTWTATPPVQAHSDLTHLTGCHALEARHFESTGNATFQVWWAPQCSASGPSSAQSVCAYDPGIQSPTGLTGDVYSLTSVPTQFPALTGTPAESIHPYQLDVTNRAGTNKFPGVQGSYTNYAIRLRGSFLITTPGRYQFRLNSDDGALLYIDGRQAVNNDGQHTAQSRTGAMWLAAGSHTAQIDYFQTTPANLALELYWTPPGGTEAYWSFGYPVSCAAILAATPSIASGVYTIDPDGASSNAPISVYCDMVNDGGGWTRVVNIKGNSFFHADQPAAVGDVSIASAAAKLSDADINRLNTVGYFRYNCGSGYNVFVRNTANKWTSSRVNAFSWSIDRSRSGTNFSCAANRSGYVFSDWSACPTGHSDYAASAGPSEGNGCYWQNEGWNRDGNLWVK